MAYSRLSEELYKLSRSWATRWTRIAKSMLVSSPTVPGHTPRRLDSIIDIRTKSERKSAQRFALHLYAKGKGEHVAQYGQGKKLAGAYEYGAREHVISPRPPKKALSFFWERAGEDVLFSDVIHPGIVAANQGKGYVHESAFKLLMEGEKELRPLARKAILGDLRAAFTSARKSR
jgi:hypothetical protein